MPSISNGQVDNSNFLLSQPNKYYIIYIHYCMHQCSIGEYICIRRKQTDNYNFDSYVEELEKGETIDPHASPERILSLYLPIQTMMTTSQTLNLVIHEYV